MFQLSAYDLKQPVTTNNQMRQRNLELTKEVAKIIDTNLNKY